MVLSDGNLITLVQEIADRLDSCHSDVGHSPVDDDVLSALKLQNEQETMGDVDFFNTARTIALKELIPPNFVEQISGFSWPESFGRWTNADIARIIFRHSLPKIFKLELTTEATGYNIGQPMLIIAGGTAQILRPCTYLPRRYQILFDCKARGNMIEFFIPHAISPNRVTRGSDQERRRLGLGIHSIKLKASQVPPIHKRIMPFIRNVL